MTERINPDYEDLKLMSKPHNYSRYSDIQNLAKERGGLLITTKEEYKNITSTPSSTEFLWQCKNGHPPFKKRLQYVKRGSWCPRCSGIRSFTYPYLKKLAEKRGLEKNSIPGKILTTLDEYNELKKSQPPNRTKYLWSCEIKNHKPWKSRLDSIVSGTWCPYCAKNQKQTLNDLKNLADSRGMEENGKPGRILLKERKYNEISDIPSKTHFYWQCGENHEPWFSTPTNIQQGRWCPKCSEGKWEKIIRFYFENIFNGKFPKSKPNWIYKLTDHKLELDGYNDLLKIAFELNGPQHYEPIYGMEKLKLQQKYDKLKRSACKAKKVILIEIPYDFDGLKNTINKGKISSFIVKEYEHQTGKKLTSIPKIDYSARKYQNYKKLDLF